LLANHSSPRSGKIRFLFERTTLLQSAAPRYTLCLKKVRVEDIKNHGSNSAKS